jgi:GntR family transcriptional regulator
MILASVLTLDHNSVVPLYEQVKETIRQEILQGELKPRQKLLTEGEYVTRFKVSIITIRRAIAELVKEGLVEKKQGKGIFVSAPKYQKNFSSRVMSFTETCIANGLKAGAKLLKAEMAVPDLKILERLELPEQTETVHIVRLRLVDDIPCVVEDNNFPPEFFRLLSINLENVSLYRLLREEWGIDILPGPLTLKIVRADKVISKLLRVPRNTPLLRSDGLLFRASGKALHSSIQIGYGEDFDFVVR